ncbi:MAG TPA: hypothetical protein VG406_26515 [Isosphaeraceae bacterium]|jgi:hypothetical protein|nr:hypothetical protein [Isosphaeraceae bacterium]
MMMDKHDAADVDRALTFLLGMVRRPDPVLAAAASEAILRLSRRASAANPDVTGPREIEAAMARYLDSSEHPGP